MFFKYGILNERIIGRKKWEEFEEDFLGMYFPRERREIKVKEFINLKQGNMSIEEYSLKFSTLCRYDPSLLSNPRDEMSHFVTGGSRLSGGRMVYRYVA